ncbi:MAG: putative glycoside hydrolase [Verrucomicrobiaceae bacterium]
MKHLAALLIISSSVVCTSIYAADGFPEFSWDRVPLYAHLAIEDGLKPEQYDFLAAHFSLIAFTGGTVKNGSVESNIAAGAKAIKERNPKTKVLFYWASDMPKPQWKDSNATCPEGGYLIAKKGGRDTKQFDVRREDVREWWSTIAGKAVHEYGCDGIFVDGATAGSKNGPWGKMFGADQAAAMDQGVFAMLKQTREKMGPGKLIIFNPLHGYDEKHPGLGEQYLPATDGAMVDDFDRNPKALQSPEYMANTIEAMRKAAKDGKIVIFKGWPKFTWHTAPEIMKKPHEEQVRLAREQITFPLACFLVGAERHCYFCYTWGWLGQYGTFDWYPEFDQKLGAPKGAAVREGWTFRREFEHASVFVDVEKKAAKIDWK